MGDAKQDYQPVERTPEEKERMRRHVRSMQLLGEEKHLHRMWSLHKLTPDKALRDYLTVIQFSAAVRGPDWLESRLEDPEFLLARLRKIFDSAAGAVAGTK